MTTSSQEIEHRSGDTKAGNATTKTTDHDRHGRDFRKHLITAAKTILSSIIDIVSDWVFYSRTKATLFLDEFNIPLLIFCIISTIFGLLTVMGLSTKVWNDPRNNTASKSPTQGITRWFVGTKWGSWLLATNHLLACEIFLEDIPQLILTALVTSRRAGGVLSPVATFNVTTSGINLVFNILDIFMPEEEVQFDDDITEHKELSDDYAFSGYGATNQQENSNDKFHDHSSA